MTILHYLFVKLCKRNENIYFAVTGTIEEIIQKCIVIIIINISIISIDVSMTLVKDTKNRTIYLALCIDLL